MTYACSQDVGLALVPLPDHILIKMHKSPKIRKYIETLLFELYNQNTLFPEMDKIPGIILV
jgi:hypothetical protein